MTATRPGSPAQLGGAGPGPQPPPPLEEPSGGWPQDSSPEFDLGSCQARWDLWIPRLGLICFSFPHQLNPGTGRFPSILSSQVPAAGKGRDRHPPHGGPASRVLTSLQMPGRTHPDGQPPGRSSHPRTTASPAMPPSRRGRLPQVQPPELRPLQQEAHPQGHQILSWHFRP